MELRKVENINIDFKKDNRQFSYEDKKLIKTLYNKYTGENKLFNSNCSSCYVDALIKLKQLNKNNNMEEKKFILKEGTLIQSFDFEKMYTNANMTDEDAIKLLKKSSAYLKHFKTYPENWQDMVMDSKDETPVIEIDTTTTDDSVTTLEEKIDNKTSNDETPAPKPFKPKKNKRW